MAQGLNSLGAWIWGWMASHPIQSLVVITSTVLIGFSVETKVWEKRRASVRPSMPDSGQKNTPIPTASTTKTLSDQFMLIDNSGQSKVTISGVEHVAGILIEVTQAADRDHAWTCEIILTDLRQIKQGDPCAVPELHNMDGSFKYGRINLPLASDQPTLFFGTPRRWWLMQGSKVNYHWGKDKTHGSFTLPPGAWTAYFEVHPGEYVLNRQFTFTWSGSGVAEFV